MGINQRLTRLEKNAGGDEPARPVAVVRTGISTLPAHLDNARPAAALAELQRTHDVIHIIRNVAHGGINDNQTTDR